MNKLSVLLFASIISFSLSKAEEIAYYKLDGDATDNSKYQRHGAMFGDIIPTFDRHGNQNKALLFGSNERLDNYRYQGGSIIVTDFKDAVINDKLSISLWVRKDSRALGVGFNNAADYQEIINSNQYGKWKFRLYTKADTAIHANKYDNVGSKKMSYYGGIMLGSWHHLVYLIDKESHSLYIDGVLVKEQHAYLELMNQGLQLQISKPGTSNYFKGAMDDIRIFNHTLSEKEIIDLYNDEYENSHNFEITSDKLKINESDKRLSYEVKLNNINSDVIKRWSILTLPNGVNYSIHKTQKVDINKGETKIINGKLRLEKWFPKGNYKYTWYLLNPKQEEGNIVLDSISFSKE